MTTPPLDSFAAGIFLSFGFLIHRPFSPIPAAEVKLGSVVRWHANTFTTEWMSCSIILRPYSALTSYGKVKLSGGFSVAFVAVGKGEITLSHSPVTVTGHVDHKTNSEAHSSASYVNCSICHMDPSLNDRGVVKKRLKSLVASNPKDFEAGGTYAVICSLITASKAESELAQNNSTETGAGGAVAVPTVASINLDGSRSRVVKGEAKLDDMENVLVGYHLWVFSIKPSWQFWKEKLSLGPMVMGTNENRVELDDSIQLTPLPAFK